MAPEVLLQTKQGRKSDIWSLGCTVIEMLTGRVPWDEHAFDNPMQAILYIAQDGRLPKLPQPISNELHDFLLLCLNREYKMRPSADELIQHPFFKLKKFNWKIFYFYFLKSHDFRLDFYFNMYNSFIIYNIYL